MGWLEFIAAFAGFFLSHSLPIRPAVKSRIVAVLGPRGFTIAYSILSLAVLYWLLTAAGRAPTVTLWDWAPWQNHVPLIAMGMVCILLALTIARPNPFSFGGAHNDRFSPDHPGLIRWTRHPILAAFAIWALAHIVPNGDLAHVILFGAFAGFSLLGMRLIDRRKRREMGAEWERQRQALRSGPLFHSPASLPEAALRAILGILTYAALLRLHPLIFGVSPYLMLPH
ncbi:NnrU family protein [Thalassovita aquimarina]|uniref:NnrU family protein n=1 Tax=Thalassovita aquimarina TaxID=2785917 RepID=A0ABS5HVF4_9RHOB|nr:NnrU family protein [Thalassovita aquimarina]MBR9652944.1 NnrU family protein [Thalassovita aquimarina]